jgi:TM2 domain-containing membrane protein YozV
MMKDKNVAAILALFLGGLGVHKFYLGRIGAGVLYLIFSVTFIPSILGLIDFFVLALMDQDEFQRRYGEGRALAGGPVVVNMLPPAGYGPGWQGAPGPYGYGGYGGYPGHPGQPGQPMGAPPAGARLSAEELAGQLEKLNELRISGILTEDEFQGQKAKLLEKM